MTGFSAVTNLGGQMKLVNLNQRLKDMMMITRLHTVFEVHDDEAAAIRSFTAEPAE
jgi:anti-sigma B factor antagonist